ncbi:hypothetical protein ACNJYA_00640 [Bradyrhizobium sp. DASA03068]|uniref:hypothetical protein n=1 Tax=Bradyrhizobium sp. BLXBL-01 TaxID=3395915 RepID=UPI003F72C5BE
MSVAVAHIESRGRLNILPRWRSKVSWLRSASEDVEALMIFSEPGLISIRDWNTHSPSILSRIEELSASSGEDSLEALRLIHDRYQKLVIPFKERPTLCDEALAHLEIDLDNDTKSLVYVCTFPDWIDLMSSGYRKIKLLQGHPLISDLP